MSLKQYSQAAETEDCKAGSQHHKFGNKIAEQFLNLVIHVKNQLG